MRFKTNHLDFLKHKEIVASNVIVWSDKASCKSVDINSFYIKEESSLKKIATRYCDACPVQNQCMYTAVVLKEDYGLWGAFTARQRRIFLKKLIRRSVSDSQDFTTWTNKLSTYIYTNTTIQKVADILNN